MLNHSAVRHALIFGVSAGIAVLTACGLETQDSRLTVEIPALRSELDERDQLLRDSLSSVTANSSGPAILPPELVSGFDCIALNVMGVGIPSVSRGDDLSPDQLMSQFGSLNYCSYPGVISKPQRVTSSPLTFEVTVPNGNDRIVELIGLKLAAGESCPASLIDADGKFIDGLNLRAFHIASVRQPITSDVQLTMTNQYKNTLPRLMSSVECGEIPTVVRVQETPGCNTTPTPHAAPTIGPYIAREYKIGLPTPAAGDAKSEVTMVSITPYYYELTAMPTPEPTSTATSVPLCAPNVVLSNEANGNQFCYQRFFSTATAKAPQGFRIKYKVTDKNNPARSFTEERSYPVKCP